MTEVVPKVLALETRLRLGLQNVEYVDLNKTLSTLHISCVKRVLQSNISGAAIKARNGAISITMILVNSARSLGHQNFTMAHELYHCLYDEGIQARACITELFENKPEIESAAELFAVHFLMPEDGVLSQLRVRDKLKDKLSVSDVIYLEQYFGVSRKAMCWRLQDLDLITRQESDEFSQHVIQSAKRLGKDISLYQPTNEETLLSDYAERANEALEKGLITQARYEEILTDAGLLDSLQNGEIEDTSENSRETTPRS